MIKKRQISLLLINQFNLYKDWKYEIGNVTIMITKNLINLNVDWKSIFVSINLNINW